MDWRAIGRAIIMPLFWWTAAILAATLGDFPGLVCLTPLGWLMGMVAGQRTVQSSQTQDPDRRLLEAAVAGGAVGVYLALLAGVVVLVSLAPVVDTISPLTFSLVAFLILGLFGAVISAGLGVIYGRLRVNRIENQ